jgi:hypothetical protein
MQRTRNCEVARFFPRYTDGVACEEAANDHLRPEGEERGATAVHEQKLAGEGLGAAGVVVDAEGEPPSGVVDGEPVGALETHAGPLPHRVHRRLLVI